MVFSGKVVEEANNSTDPMCTDPELLYLKGKCSLGLINNHPDISHEKWRKQEAWGSWNFLTGQEALPCEEGILTVDTDF